MTKHDVSVTRFVSFLDHPDAPVQLKLELDQEVIQEERPEAAENGQVLRFLFVRGPAHRPIHYLREEQLPDGSTILVRYRADVDVPCH